MHAAPGGGPVSVGRAPAVWTKARRRATTLGLRRGAGHAAWQRLRLAAARVAMRAPTSRASASASSRVRTVAVEARDRIRASARADGRTREPGGDQIGARDRAAGVRDPRASSAASGAAAPAARSAQSASSSSSSSGASSASTAPRPRARASARSMRSRSLGNAGDPLRQLAAHREARAAPAVADVASRAAPARPRAPRPTAAARAPPGRLPRPRARAVAAARPPARGSARPGSSAPSTCQLGEQPQRARRIEPERRVLEELLDLAPAALPAHARRRRPSRSASRSAVREPRESVKPSRAREARRAQRARRIVVKALPDGSTRSTRAGEVLAAPRRDRSRAGRPRRAAGVSGSASAFTREVAPAQILLERAGLDASASAPGCA